MEEAYGLKAAAVAVYPMYRGLAKLVGMTVVEPGKTLADQMEVVKDQWEKFDFFFIHYKYTDSTGEDGNFAKKVEMIEALDAEMPKLRALNPDVLIVTGDHSTPSRMKSHSFHPVPTLLWAPATVRPDLVTTFGERPCLQGGLGQFLAKTLMPLALAHAGRLQKFGSRDAWHRVEPVAMFGGRWDRAGSSPGRLPRPYRGLVRNAIRSRTPSSPIAPSRPTGMIDVALGLNSSMSALATIVALAAVSTTRIASAPSARTIPARTTPSFVWTTYGT